MPVDTQVVMPVDTQAAMPVNTQAAMPVNTQPAMPAIGILGGSFDPVHNAHLALAHSALEQLKLDKILWIPGGTPPHRAPPQASAEQRAAMLQLAIAGEPRFALDTRELKKTSPSYTVETLEELRSELGAHATLVLLIGADQYARLDTWHRWKSLFDLARIAVFARPGLEIAPGKDAVTAQEVVTVAMTPMDISSTAIRARIAAGDPPRGLLPDAVLDYIGRERLYSPAETRTH